MRHSPTLQSCAEVCVDHQIVADWSQFCRKAMSNFILICSLQLIFMVVGRGECGKVVEIDNSYFSRQKCNCGRLCTTVWVFVGVEQELGHLSCACHWSLHWDIAIIKAGILPSTTIVSGCWRYNICLHSDGLTHHSLNRSASFVAHGCSQIRSRPLGCTSRLTSGLTEKTKLYVW